MIEDLRVGGWNATQDSRSSETMREFRPEFPHVATRRRGRETRTRQYGSPKHTRSDSEGGPAHGTFPQSRKRAWNLTDLRTPSSKAEDVACVSSSSMRKAREKVALTAAHTCPAAREFFFDPGTDALPTVIWFVQ